MQIFSHLNWALILLGLADLVWISFSCFSLRIRSASKKYVAVMWLYLLVSRALEKQGECIETQQQISTSRTEALKVQYKQMDPMLRVFKILKGHKQEKKQVFTLKKTA